MIDANAGWSRKCILKSNSIMSLYLNKLTGIFRVTQAMSKIDGKDFQNGCLCTNQCIMMGKINYL